MAHIGTCVHTRWLAAPPIPLRGGGPGPVSQTRFWLLSTLLSIASHPRTHRLTAPPTPAPPPGGGGSACFGPTGGHDRQDTPHTPLVSSEGRTRGRGAGPPTTARKHAQKAWENRCDTDSWAFVKKPACKILWVCHAHSQFENRSRSRVSPGLPLMRCFTGRNHFAEATPIRAQLS